MREIEAQWIREKLGILDPETISPLIEIGSSTREFREFEKPHIEREVHAPLRSRGVRIVTSDLKYADGVDFPGDIYDPDVQKSLLDINAKALMICNIFEHLTDRAAFARVCRGFVGSDARIIVTVPNDFPYHLDPIDTMFRPSTTELSAMFPDARVDSEDILVDGTYWDDLRANMSRTDAVLLILRELARAILLRGGVQRSISRLSRLKYLFHPYKVAAVILRTPSRAFPASD